MTDLTKKIADARRLDAEATPGPWNPAEHMVDVEGGKRELATCVLFEGDRDNRNAQLIAHARNHHAALWDLVEAAREMQRLWDKKGRFNVVEMDRAAKNLHAALACLEQVQP